MANMRRVQPEMQRIQERYKNDRQKLSMEMMTLYRKEGVNPMGGCLPMLASFPFFIALFFVLRESRVKTCAFWFVASGPFSA